MFPVFFIRSCLKNTLAFNQTPFVAIQIHKNSGVVNQLLLYKFEDLGRNHHIELYNDIIQPEFPAPGILPNLYAHSSLLAKRSAAARIMIPSRMLDIVDDSSITTPARKMVTTGSYWSPLQPRCSGISATLRQAAGLLLAVEVQKIMIDIAHLNW